MHKAGKEEAQKKIGRHLIDNMKYFLHDSVVIFSEAHSVQYLLGGTGKSLNISSCCLTSLFEQRLVGKKRLHGIGKVLVACNLEATTIGLQPLCLTEALIVGTEEYGHSPYRSLKDIVYSHAEATAHVCHLTIMVDAGEQSEAVDYEHLCLGG